MEPIKGFKGFDKDLKCRDFQYEVGGEYETVKAELCETGFHFCEHPLDVFSYYPPAQSRYAEVTGNGKTDQGSADTKVACTHIKIGAELDLSAMCKAAVKFVFDRVDFKNSTDKATGDRGAASATGDQGAASATGHRGAASATGDQGAASATGYQGAASATGYLGAASATGDQGAASATGDHSIACGLGYECSAAGKVGCWIVLAERRDDGSIISVKAFEVDGEKVKENQFYKLRRGKLVKA